jgi:CheY-like chemotaxis protein
VISEKRLQHATSRIEIEAAEDTQSYGLFIAVNEGELKRVLSNLIDNAVEASRPLDRVTVRIVGEDQHVRLTVSDTGKGIPAEVLPRLTEQGFTHDKPHGSGLGLYHARSFVERFGGALAIRSTVGAGTDVEIRLPQAAAPSWFVGRIELEAGMAVLVLDDEEPIHATWDQLLAPHTQAGVHVLHFREPQALRAWLAHHRNERFLGFIDHQLVGSDSTGLDLIEQEGLAAHSFLVTGRYAEPSVLQRVLKLGLRMIPKEFVGRIPIGQVPLAPQAPAATDVTGLRVLVVDDDEMIARIWRQQQKRLGVGELRTFTSMEACEAARVQYETFDLAFVDLRIAGTSWPIDKTLRHLKERGVRRVFIATGAHVAPDLLGQGADGIAEDKVPLDLEPFCRGLNTRGPRS